MDRCSTGDWAASRNRRGIQACSSTGSPPRRCQQADHPTCSTPCRHQARRNWWRRLEDNSCHPRCIRKARSNSARHPCTSNRVSRNSGTACSRHRMQRRNTHPRPCTRPVPWQRTHLQRPPIRPSKLDPLHHRPTCHPSRYRRRSPMMRPRPPSPRIPRRPMHPLGSWYPLHQSFR